MGSLGCVSGHWTGCFPWGWVLSAGTCLSRHGCTAWLSQRVTGLKHFLKIRIVFLQEFNLCFVAKFRLSEVKIIGCYVILQELWSHPYCPFD